MHMASSSLPIPLWLEYSHVKSDMQSKQPSPPFFPSPLDAHSLLHEPSTSAEDHFRKVPRPPLSISVSPDKTLLLSSGKTSMMLVSPTNPLKQSILSLKKSVQDLKRNSRDLYGKISELGRKAASTYSSPVRTKTHIYSKLALYARSDSTQRSHFSDSKEDKHIQADPNTHFITPNETMESVGKLLSFSQLAESKKSAQTPSIPEADISDAESGQMTFDGSPRSVPGRQPEEIRRNSSQKRHLTFVKPSSVSDSKPPQYYYLKVVNINGKYHLCGQLSTELVLGKQANMGITLKGKDTEGGFRVFTSAQDAMGPESPKFVPMKGGRLCLMKVQATGPSLR